MNESLPAAAVFNRMAAYAGDLERTSPPVFVGRQAELAELKAVVERVALRNPRSMMRIVQGVPGAGKSSLCDEFLASVQGQTIGGRRVLCAKLHPSDLNLPPLSLVGRPAAIGGGSANAGRNTRLLGVDHQRRSLARVRRVGWIRGRLRVAGVARQAGESVGSPIRRVSSAPYSRIAFRLSHADAPAGCLRVDHDYALQLLETAERRGILRRRKMRTKDHFLPPPIPSMATYLATTFDDVAREGDGVARAIAERCGIACT